MNIEGITPPFNDEIQEAIAISFDKIKILTTTEKLYFYNPQSKEWSRYCYSCELIKLINDFGEMDEFICDSCCWDALETETLE